MSWLSSPMYWVDPTPSWPRTLIPKHRTFLFVSMAQVIWSPALTLWIPIFPRFTFWREDPISLSPSPLFWVSP